MSPPKENFVLQAKKDVCPLICNILAFYCSNFGVTKIVPVHVPVLVFHPVLLQFCWFFIKKKKKNQHESERQREQNVNVNDFVPVHERGRKQEQEREWERRQK